MKTYTEDAALAMVAAALREQISHASEWASETFDGDPVSIADWLDASMPQNAKAALARLLDAALAERMTVQEAAKVLLAGFVDRQDLPDAAHEAAQDAHSDGDAGNANDCVEAFLRALASESRP